MKKELEEMLNGFGELDLGDIGRRAVIIGDEDSPQRFRITQQQDGSYEIMCISFTTDPLNVRPRAANVVQIFVGR